MLSDINSDVIQTCLTTLTLNESSPMSQEISSSQYPRNEIGLSRKIKPVEETMRMKRPPPHNVPEKVIFCLDTYSDSNSTAFKVKEGTAYSTLYMLKRVIELFVLNKSCIDSRHEFALLTFDKLSLKWIQELTNKPREIIKSLSNVSESTANLDDNEFDLSVLLEQVWQMVKVPKPEKDINIPPPFIVHFILLYSRNSVPILKKNFKELLTNPYFVIDVILSHEEEIEDGRHEEILDSLCIDEKEYSYNFAVGRNVTILHDSMAKLLAHPLQRSLQSHAMYQSPVFEKEE